MSTNLNAEFWTKRYLDQQTGWDLGTVSPPLKAYIDQLTDRDLRILIPGCGNAHEGAYLWREGFKNTHLLDFAEPALVDFSTKNSDFNLRRVLFCRGIRSRLFQHNRPFSACRKRQKTTQSWLSIRGWISSSKQQFLSYTFLTGMRHIKLMNFYYCCVWRSLISGHGEPHWTQPP